MKQRKNDSGKENDEHDNGSSFSAGSHARECFFLDSSAVCIIITCASAMLAKQVLFFSSVCPPVCLSVCPRKKILIRNWCNLLEICAKVNLRSDWILVTSDLEFKV